MNDYSTVRRRHVAVAYVEVAAVSKVAAEAQGALTGPSATNQSVLCLARARRLCRPSRTWRTREIAVCSFGSVELRLVLHAKISGKIRTLPESTKDEARKNPR